MNSEGSGLDYLPQNKFLNFKKIEIVQMPETLETSVEGSWNVDSAGGPRKLLKKDNPSWCQNT